MSLLDFFKAFPAAWVVIGTIISGFIFYFANRRVFALQRESLGTLTEVHKETIRTLSIDRDSYRDKLHTERDEHQKHLSELEALRQRPDLTTIHGLLSEQSDVMRTIGKSVESHIASDAVIFAQINDSMTKIPVALSTLTNRIESLNGSKKTRKSRAA